MRRSAFDHAVDYAISRARTVGDVGQLPEVVRVVALVHTAQAVIDNGGLHYFFEIDFPGRPSYGRFSAAYLAIGAEEAATNLERAVKLFPFDNPHLNVRKRNACMDRFRDSEGNEREASPFRALERHLCGNAGVWRCLRAYVRTHANSFQPR